MSLISLTYICTMHIRTVSDSLMAEYSLAKSKLYSLD